MSSFPSHWQLQNAARCVRAGGVIAYPTEAVFGLGCDPANKDAVMRLLALKRRPADKGLILIASDWQQLQPWLQTVPDAWYRRMDATWPGPTTWLVPAALDCPGWLTGGRDTLAVRVTAHPVVRELCENLGYAIVSTSANRSGQMPARSLLGVRLRFGEQLDFVLPGPLGKLSKPTQIRDLATDAVIRE